MEEKIQVIKNNLTGNIEEDINFLNSLYKEERLVIEEATSTIEAINIVIEEIKKVFSSHLYSLLILQQR